MEHQLDATITVLLISKISSTCFGQTFAHLQERKTEIFTTCGIMSCWCGRQFFWVCCLALRVHMKEAVIVASSWCSKFILPCEYIYSMRTERQTDMARLIVDFRKFFTFASKMKKLYILSYTCPSSSCRILINYFKYLHTQDCNEIS
jgi:hypothetical protein